MKIVLSKEDKLYRNKAGDIIVVDNKLSITDDKEVWEIFNWETGKWEVAEL